MPRYRAPNHSNSSKEQTFTDLLVKKPNHYKV